MLFGRIILGLTALSFLVYGFVCLLSPEVPAGFLRLVLNSSGDTTATVEFTAMYGGLQVAMGLVFGWHMLDRNRLQAGLGIMATLLAGLGLARAIGLASYGVDRYNGGAVCYELGSTVLATIAWLTIHRRA